MMIKTHLVAPAIMDLAAQLEKAEPYIKENYAERLEVNLQYIHDVLTKYRGQKDRFFIKKRK